MTSSGQTSTPSFMLRGDCEITSWLRCIRNALIALLLCSFVTSNARCAEPPQKPQRLVSICAQGDQLLLELAEPNHILAVSKLADDPDISPHWQEARKVPKVAASAEAILRLKPDLVLVGQYTATLTAGILRKLGVPILELGVPNNFSELRKQIRDAAKALGEPEKAEEIIRQMDARLESVKRDMPPNRPTAMFYFQDGFIPGGHTFPNEILEAAGFRNLGAELDKNFGVSASLERVVLSHPQFLILTRYRDAHPTATQISEQQPVFRKLIGRTQVLSVSFRHLSTPDPRNLDLVEELHRQLKARIQTSSTTHALFPIAVRP